MFLAYATAAGRALIDRAVYLPVPWTDDPDRCAAAGIPDDVGFATKITLGRRMLERALDAGVPAGWATADEFYGGDRGLRRDLQARRLGYVLAVAKSHRVNIGGLHGTARGDHIAATLTRRRRGTGTAPATARKAPGVTTGPGSPSSHPPTRQPGSIGSSSAAASRDGELAFYRCYHPTRVAYPPSCGSPAPGGQSRAASRTRKAPSVSTSTRSAAGTPGTATPPWSCSPPRSWSRSPPPKRRRPTEPGLIPLTVIEIRRLFAKLDHRHHPTGQLPPGLVPMATHPPSPRREPATTASRGDTDHRPSIYITNPGWTTRPTDS